MPPRADRSRSREGAAGSRLRSEGRNRLTFGRHEGERYNAMWRNHQGYCRWALGISNPSGQLRHFQNWLRRRQAAESEGGVSDGQDDSDEDSEDPTNDPTNDSSEETSDMGSGPTIGDLLVGGRLAEVMIGGMQHPVNVQRILQEVAEAVSSHQRDSSGLSSAAVLEQLPRIAYSTDLFNGNPHPATCQICLEDWPDVSGDILLTPCLHVFHEKCLRDWVSRSTDCPSCRWDMSKSGDQGRPATSHDIVQRPALGDLAGTVVTVDDDSQN